MVTKQWRLLPQRLLLGVPFYARHVETHQMLPFFELPSVANDTDEVDGFFFNGPETLRWKADLARNAGLAGVAVWEVTQDDARGSLLAALQPHRLHAEL